MRNTSIFVRDGGSIVTVTLGSVVQSFSVISINSLAQTFVQSYDGITNLYWWFLSTRMCAETRRRRLVVSCSWLCFLTLDVRSYSWHQLEVRKKKNNKKKQNLKITSQSFHFTSDPWQLQSAVIVRWYLKQRHGLTDLTFVYIIVKLQTYCIFSSYVLSLFFLLLLMTCMEYVSVTASALVMGKSKQSHWFSLDSVCCY